MAWISSVPFWHSQAVWALYWILNLRDPRDPLVKLVSGFLFGAVYVTVLAALASEPFPVSKGSVYCALYVGVFEMGITFVLWLKALEADHHETLIGNLAFLSPFLSLVFIHWIVGEEIHTSSLAGLVLIVSGIAVQTASSRGSR
jgi:drug/metabolite transporter (DMT)-like permease